MKKTQVIFNMYQANQLILNGINPLGVNVHKETKKVYLTFENTEELWSVIDRCKSSKIIDKK
ncbi:DUF5659 domain-containing protein [Paraclostridium sordellii]|uniref:DUF5659 domain-containing protein n=1 Tax=Paraclostridium sordellii TaxID=1505 RepID=UPI0005DF9AEF|nr:DUF5659 domain-containing protein [Paeniclostridium sordellii]CEO25197.1 Uncharacterised protein [[Clostridium] sordellii] [Paeniclostridium sordellii]